MGRFSWALSVLTWYAAGIAVLESTAICHYFYDRVSSHLMFVLLS